MDHILVEKQWCLGRFISIFKEIKEYLKESKATFMISKSHILYSKYHKTALRVMQELMKEKVKSLREREVSLLGELLIIELKAYFGLP